MTSKLIIVALGTVLIAAPVSAKGTNNEDKSNQKTTTAAVDTKKYCIQYDDLVGSRISRSQCLTREEWKRKNVDVDKILDQ